MRCEHSEHPRSSVCTHALACSSVNEARAANASTAMRVARTNLQCVGLARVSILQLHAWLEIVALSNLPCIIARTSRAFNTITAHDHVLIVVMNSVRSPHSSIHAHTINTRPCRCALVYWRKNRRSRCVTSAVPQSRLSTQWSCRQELHFGARGPTPYGGKRT
jgi:hypothetical protein